MREVGDQGGGDELGGQLEHQVADVDSGEHQVDERDPVADDDAPAAPDQIRLGHRVLFVGNTGTGKSEGLLHLFAVHGGQRILIDVQDHYTLGPAALAEEPAPIEVDDPRAIDWRHRTIRYVVKRPGDRKEMDALHAAIFRRGNIFVACDEAEDVAPSTGAGAPFYVKKCVKQGRKYRITYGAATQRPAGVDRSIINQAEHAFIFPMVDQDDLDTLSHRVGMSARELGETLRQLGRFEYLRHTIGGVPIHMPPLPPAAVTFTRRHVDNPAFRPR